ncbi:hypothetical protein F5Y00DRAFT_262955 [Daldinia vernicosa]|uniref:uncharacterized protein n=1 Tax=Daldinia vernicosa TaxID=114800 RepID=UPI0020082A37|nr:uncharacterized protein F5Y00DRAFT_262955 [Daldinia vernicosa]KAI0848055.1 hypothetical protein F5Y00DRAFT_262955 [Daldinia vernicosa]
MSYFIPFYLVASDILLAIFSLIGISQYLLKAAHDKFGEIGQADLPKDPRFYNGMMLSKETITPVSDEDAIPVR